MRYAQKKESSETKNKNRHLKDSKNGGAYRLSSCARSFLRLDFDVALTLFRTVMVMLSPVKVLRLYSRHGGACFGVAEELGCFVSVGLHG